MTKTEIIIVGQGIAGTLLSFLLYEKSIPHVVVADPGIASASEVSAGIINPLVFKRITKSWKADILIPFAKKVYFQLEKFLQKEFYRDVKMAKIISSHEELDWWKNRVENQQLQEYIETFDNSVLPAESFRAFTYAVINQVAHVNARVLLSEYRHFLREHHLILEEKFDFERLSVGKSSLVYGNYKARKIVFCEGSGIIQNPYFNYIPFYLTRGDLLKIRFPGFQSDYIINKDKFLLPEGDHFIFGSTYEWTDKLNFTGSEQGKQDLINHLKTMTNMHFEIIDHYSGIRPTIKDRRPVLGEHPEYPQLLVFNGLGTKGFMLGPYHAWLLSEYLSGSIQGFEKEISVNRFWKK